MSLASATADRRAAMRWRRAASPVLVAVAIIGGTHSSCGSDDSAAGINVQCAIDDDCPTSEVCLTGTCRAASVPDRVFVEVTPAGGSAFVPTQFADVSPAQRPLTFELPLPVDYSVEVFDGDQQRTAASVTFFRADSVDGRPLAIDAFVDADGPASVRLTPGEYRVVIRPSEGPPIEVQDFLVRAEPGTVRKDFLVPERFRRLSGTVSWSRSSQVLLEGVVVRAIAVGSGLISTTTITDASGAYAIDLPEADETFFELEADPPASSQPNWSYRQLVRVDLERDRVLNIGMDIADDDDKGSVRLQIVGVARDDIARPVENAQVTLTATVTGVEVPPAFSISGTTDADGLVRVGDGASEIIPLLRARYDVEIRTPIDSQFSGRSATLDLTGAALSFSRDEQISLSIRTLVDGLAVSASGAPLAEALVTFEPAQGTQTSVVTGPQGRFSVDLDPGPYLMIVEPLDARTETETVPVASIAVIIEPAIRQTLPNFVAPPGTVLEGVVIAPSGAPETNATLQFFDVEADRPIEVGRSATDAFGQFRVVLGR